ncbi:unnamed protein product, partial [Haemonchus placei]|uniref:CBM20 domain-containing protein n=1 Tax=Haemonchus placei TaxID=6290 RepID=A0A0N4VTN1_HAEPC
MMEKTRVQFQVRVLRLKLWEKMFACGSDVALGAWDPLKAFPLTKSLTDRYESFTAMQIFVFQNAFLVSKYQFFQNVYSLNYWDFSRPFLSV